MIILLFLVRGTGVFVAAKGPPYLAFLSLLSPSFRSLPLSYRRVDHSISHSNSTPSCRIHASASRATSPMPPQGTTLTRTPCTHTPIQPPPNTGTHRIHTSTMFLSSLAEVRNQAMKRCEATRSLRTCSVMFLSASCNHQTHTALTSTPPPTPVQLQ